MFGFMIKTQSQLHLNIDATGVKDRCHLQYKYFGRIWVHTQQENLAKKCGNHRITYGIKKDIQNAVDVTSNIYNQPLLC